MRSHLAPRSLILLLVVMLMGALAVPAEGKKRPRRYSEVVLVDWTICETKAALTIGRTGVPEDYPDPDPPTTPPPTGTTVRVDAELANSPGSIIEGGPRDYPLLDERNEEIGPVAELGDGVGDFVTDVPLDENGEEIPLDPDAPSEWIIYKATVEAGWSPEAVEAGLLRPLRVGDRIRLSMIELADTGTLNSALFEVVSCPSSDGSETDDSSPGVTTTGPSLTTEEIRDLSARIDETSEVGRGEGGSLIPRAQCTIVGKAGDDRIVGTPGNDVICGLGGNDVIAGAGGIDVIDGASGNDRVTGGAGRDLLLGLRGNDRLNGSSGGDKASGGAGVDRVKGSSGNDALVSGGSGNDLVSGGPGRDRINGGSGNDDIRARDRTRDTVNGASGLDSARVDRPGSAASARRRADRVRGVEQLL
jgi:Ca2+-binding RTX toxin-like protein